MTQPIEGHSSQAAREKVVIQGRLSEIKSQMRGLRSHVLAVDEFLNTKFHTRRGAPARTDSPRQRQDSPRVVEGSTSVRQARATSSAAAAAAAASCPAVLTPTPTPAENNGASNARSPTASAGATVFGTIQRDVRAGAIRVEISDLINGHPKMSPFCKARKLRGLGK